MYVRWDVREALEVQIHMYHKLTIKWFYYGFKIGKRARACVCLCVTCQCFARIPVSKLTYGMLLLNDKV